MCSYSSYVHEETCGVPNIMANDVVSPTKQELRRNSLLFVALISVVCGWVLSLPVFPSQDGPAHKFYAGVLGAELFGDPYSHAYVIRTPVPPYATEDYLLALSSRIIDINLAEKLFVCLILIVTAGGVRLCCRQIGPSGAWASLFVVPLLLHWPLMMGYMNYALGLGLMLVAFGLWISAGSAARSAGYWAAFALVLLVLVFTHPVPLMMLLLLCTYDLLTHVGWPLMRGQPAPRRALQQMVALGPVVAALFYSLLFSDRSRSTQNMKQTMFRSHAYISDLLLRGLSPFYRHSHALSVNLYRAAIYVVLLGAIAFAARGLRARLPRALTRADFMLFSALLLYLAIPLMPDSINGAIDFFSRMLVMVWILVLFAASQYPLGPRGRSLAVLASVIIAAITLVAGEIHLRPAANQLAALNHIVLPANAHGLILGLEGDPRQMPGLPHELETSPMLWSSMVPMLRAHDVPINSPWMDITYFPLRLGSDPKMLYNIVQTTAARQNVDQHDGDLRTLSPKDRQSALAAVDFIFALRNQTSQQDLSSQLGSAADGFTCSAHGWYLLCFHKPSA